MKPTTSAERQAAGVQALAALINYWFSRAGFSHDQLAAILDWANQERNPVQSTALSRIRNGNQKRGAGLMHLDAIAQGNEAIWCWQTLGEAVAIERYGPFSGWGVRPEWLSDACWLPAVVDTTKPLGLGELAEVTAGRLVLPYLSEAKVSPGQATVMNEGLERLIGDLVRERRWSVKQAIRAFSAAYPATDSGRQQRLKALVMGDVQLTADQLEGELSALTEMFRVVRGLEQLNPGELKSELLTGNRFDRG